MTRNLVVPAPLEQTILFELIANAIHRDGYWVGENALPRPVLSQLQAELKQRQLDEFKKASIGRGPKQTRNPAIRRDKILWLDNQRVSLNAWRGWTADLQRYLNQRLFLGLFSFENHFALYEPGDFYRLHYDAFKGQSNRVLSLVTYLNNDWPDDAGGELLVYDQHQALLVRVQPKAATVVLFLSEEFPHEVLPVHQERYSIAGWFRVNSSHTQQVDPPK